MSFTKPTDINNLWAESGSKTTPPTSKRSLGWVAEKPSFQYFNSVLYRTDLFNAYINERGIAEWDSSTEYTADKSYIVGSDGLLYKARVSQDNNDPVTDDGTNWRLISDELGSVTWNVNYDYLQGSLVHYSGKLWVAQESSTGVIPSISADEWQEVITYLEMFKKIYAAMFTNGQSSLIGIITEGVDVSGYEYMIYPDDGRIYLVGSVTGTITAAFDPADGSDAGLSGDLSIIQSNSLTLGVGQTYVDETSNRSIGVTYTNNADSPIFISVTTTNSAGASADANLTVDGSLVQSQRSYGNSPLVPFSNVAAVIPIGATYSVSGNTLSRWMELK